MYVPQDQGRFLHCEVLETIQALAKRSGGRIVGMDLAEVAPAYDPRRTVRTSVCGAPASWCSAVTRA
jgi:agmatinase